MPDKKQQQPNDRKNGVTRFCLAVENHRRTEAGRVRTAKEMRDYFFPMTNDVAEDRILHYVPQNVRGPIIAEWGIRGKKSALTDSDEKVRTVVADALVAGDIDEKIFEEGLDSQTLIDWVPLTDWWNFWRTGKLTGVAIQHALAMGREIGLFDDRWFLDNLAGRGGKVRGTDMICETLSKDVIVSWLRKVHEVGDGSPAGLVAALGWDVILAKTTQEALLFALDALAKHVGLAQDQTPAASPRASTLQGIPPIAIPDIPSEDLELEDTSKWASAE